MPCVPYLEPELNLAIPPVGSAAWVTFERGDPDYPVWSGSRALG